MDYESLQFALEGVENSLDNIAINLNKDAPKYNSSVGDLWSFKVLAVLEDFKTEEYVFCETVMLESPTNLSFLMGKYLIVQKYSFEPQQDENLNKNYLKIHSLNLFQIPYDDFLVIHNMSVTILTDLIAKVSEKKEKKVQH